MNKFILKNGSGSLCCKGCGKQDNKLNTYDWLADIPGNAETEDMVEVQFKNTRKGYYKNSNRIRLEKGDIVAVEASRIMYKRIKELIASRETFAMETTLATRSVANLIREAQREGYYVTLLYFWLNTPDLAVERVKMRVAAGGHNIPEATIRRRYEAGIHNLFELYLPISDYWLIADNSMSPMQIIAKGFKRDKIEILNPVIYKKLENHD